MKLLLIFLLLPGCTNPNIPISDIMHPEVHNNIYIDQALKEALQAVAKHKEEATRTHLDVHAQEEQLLQNAIAQLKQLHKEAEENARRRFEDIEKVLQLHHQKSTLTKHD